MVLKDRNLQAILQLNIILHLKIKNTNIRLNNCAISFKTLLGILSLGPYTIALIEKKDPPHKNRKKYEEL